jgi:hypothetical protein
MTLLNAHACRQFNTLSTSFSCMIFLSAVHVGWLTGKVSQDFCTLFAFPEDEKFLLQVRHSQVLGGIACQLLSCLEPRQRP